MWILIYLALGGLAVFVASSKIIDKVHSIQIELNELNTLLKCESCGKFHRKYQEELEMRISNKYQSYLTCPRCFGQSVIYNEEEFNWIKQHVEFPRLNNRDLKKLKKLLTNIDHLSYEDKSIEKFLYYHHLLPEAEDIKEHDSRNRSNPKL